MKLTPSNQDDGTWALVDPVGRVVQRGFATRNGALHWAEANGFEAHDTGGGPISQGRQP